MNGERSRRVEWAQVVATLAIGVIAPLIALEATTRATRGSARSIRETTREQRSFDDLVELRAVLDRAAGDLQSLDRAADSAIAGPDGLQLALDATSKARHDADRLEIRLGRSAAAARSFRDATHAFREAVGAWTSSHQPGDRRQPDCAASSAQSGELRTYCQSFLHGHELHGEFLDAAFALAQSKTHP